jgi:hypothetical protein
MRRPGAGAKPFQTSRARAAIQATCVVRAEDQDFEAVREVDLLQLSRCRQDDGEVPCLKRAPEVRVWTPLDRHEHMFAGKMSGERQPLGEANGAIDRARSDG